MAEHPHHACRICKHPDRDFLERAIFNDTMSRTEVARHVGCDPALVTHHLKKCIGRALVRAAETDVAIKKALDVAAVLEESHSTTMSILNDALAEGDRKTALDALAVEVKQMSLIARVTGQIGAAPQINVLLTQDYMDLKQVLVNAVSEIPEARHKLVQALSKLAEPSEVIDVDVSRS